jgi:hypothetical protein
MRATATFDLSAPPDKVLTYLSNPRNIVIANNDGPVVEQSDPPVRAGSWSVLAFDQLRVRVQYTAFESPTLVAASTTVSGPGSGGVQGSYVYQLRPIRATGGTRVTLDAESSGGWMPETVSRLFWPMFWRQIRSRMEKGSRRGA